ncbi:unnamed protein product [Miscanthus lutarioriparius]|uniref:Uncharacterized protein n=1 Tax=Miscanthus lutarioriparius TaxID=422564 RepID=A0A811MQT4_9POAL|nr:unnamed protein product [Miscanthus lutarioriparius]
MESFAVEEPKTIEMAPGAGRHDDREFDHSQNDELRMCGMAGDDEDDDVHEDAAVLFGHSAADPLPIDDSDPLVDVANADGGQSEVSPIGSNRPSTSVV